MRLTTIHNWLKGTMFANGGLELLQMGSEPDTGHCVNEDVGPSKGMDCEIGKTKHSL